jgi:hypothetical protein
MAGDWPWIDGAGDDSTVPALFLFMHRGGLLEGRKTSGKKNYFYFLLASISPAGKARGMSIAGSFPRDGDGAGDGPWQIHAGTGSRSVKRCMIVEWSPRRRARERETALAPGVYKRGCWNPVTGIPAPPWQGIHALEWMSMPRKQPRRFRGSAMEKKCMAPFPRDSPGAAVTGRVSIHAREAVHGRETVHE